MKTIIKIRSKIKTICPQKAITLKNQKNKLKQRKMKSIYQNKKIQKIKNHNIKPKNQLKLYK